MPRIGGVDPRFSRLSNVKLATKRPSGRGGRGGHSGGQEADSESVEISATAITAFDGSYVILSWSTPDVLHADDAFIVVARNGGTLAYLAITATGYTDTTLVAGSDYTYRVDYYHGLPS